MLLRNTYKINTLIWANQCNIALLIETFIYLCISYLSKEDKMSFLRQLHFL